MSDVVAALVSNPGLPVDVALCAGACGVLFLLLTDEGRVTVLGLGWLFAGFTFPIIGAWCILVAAVCFVLMLVFESRTRRDAPR